MNVSKHIEVVTHTHRGVAVTVQIDYDNEMISLVEQNRGNIPMTYKAKQWVFANRTIDYMAGWQDVLDAMKNAVSIATAALALHKQAQEDATAELMVELSRADRVKKKKKK